MGSFTDNTDYNGQCPCNILPIVVKKISKCEDEDGW